MVKAYGSQNIEFGSSTSGDIRLKIAKSHMKALDQPSQPCKKDTEGPDTSQCIANFIEDKIGCRIKLHGTNISKGSTCKSGLQLQHFTRILRNLTHADDTTIYEQTGCLGSCERHEYHEFEYHRNDLVWMMCQGGNQSCELTLRLEMNDRSYEEKRQYVVYDFNSFVADVGGFMGLLLGFSMLSIYDELTTKLKGWKFGRLSKKVSNKEKS